MKALLIVVGVTLSGLATASPRKPSAPVAVHLESAIVPGGYEVTLVATPVRAVPAIELQLAGQRLAFPATAAGERRVLTVRIPLASGDGADVIGTARAAGRSKATLLRVGTAKREAPRRATIRTLPDGRTVREVR